MTAQSPFTDSPILPPVVSDESGNNPRTELKKNIPWVRVVRGDIEETMPLITPPPPPPAETDEDQAISSPGDHIQTDISNAGSPKKAVEIPPIAPAEPAMEDQETISLPDDHIDTAVDLDSPKKPAWNKPIGGVSPLVIGGITSWPALSESTRPVATETSKRPVADKQPVSISKAPVISRLPPKQAAAGRSSNNGTNNMAADRHRWNNRNGNHTVRNSHSSFFRPMPMPPPPPYPCFELAYRPYMFPRFPLDQSSRKVNFASRPPGESSHLGINEFRHGQESKFRDGNFGVPFRGFMNSPFPPPPPPPMGPFVSPIRYDSNGYPWLVIPPAGSSYHSPPHQGVVSTIEEHANSLIRQVDYYFSDENLVKDDFLRSYMDDNGWVPVMLIAGFPRVQQITSDVGQILNYLSCSMVVEVRKGKVRRIHDWRKWVPSSRKLTSEEKGEFSSPDEPSSST